jgi:hypothetical protein
VPNNANMSVKAQACACHGMGMCPSARMRALDGHEPSKQAGCATCQLCAGPAFRAPHAGTDILGAHVVWESHVCEGVCGTTVKHVAHMYPVVSAAMLHDISQLKPQCAIIASSNATLMDNTRAANILELCRMSHRTGCQHGTNMASTWHQHGIKMVSTWCQPGVNMVSTWCQHGVHMASTCCQLGVNTASMTLCSQQRGFGMALQGLYQGIAPPCYNRVGFKRVSVTPCWCQRGVATVSPWCQHGVKMASTWRQHGVNIVSTRCRHCVNMVSTYVNDTV